MGKKHYFIGLNGLILIYYLNELLNPLGSDLDQRFQMLISIKWPIICWAIGNLLYWYLYKEDKEKDKK